MSPLTWVCEGFLPSLPPFPHLIPISSQVTVGTIYAQTRKDDNDGVCKGTFYGHCLVLLLKPEFHHEEGISMARPPLLEFCRIKSEQQT